MKKLIREKVLFWLKESNALPASIMPINLGSHKDPVRRAIADAMRVSSFACQVTRAQPWLWGWTVARERVGGKKHTAGVENERWRDGINEGTDQDGRFDTYVCVGIYGCMQDVEAGYETRIAT